MVRVFDSMVFEDETTDRLQIGIEGHGELSAEQSRQVMHLCIKLSLVHALVCSCSLYFKTDGLPSIHMYIYIYLRQIATGPQMHQFQSGLPAVASGSGTGGVPPPGDIPKPKKAVPYAKQLSSKISTSSAKLTELMAWEAKVKDCTTLLLV